MANFLDKFKINTAIKDHVKLDLSSDHITTSNFMQYDIAFAKEMVPKEKISINMETFARLSPMPVPTFGRARINNRAFFVPFRTIFPAWNDFITDIQHSNASGTSGVVNSVPQISVHTIWNFMRNNAEDYQIMQEFQDGDYNPQTEPMDFVDESGNGYRLLSNGRWFVKLLNSLGYQIAPYTRPTGINYSALPLLATAKVYYDWYYPSAYADDLLAKQLNSFFRKDNYVGVWVLSESDIEQLFLSIEKFVNYDSDYFTSAWQNANSPNDGSYSSMSFGDINRNTPGNEIDYFEIKTTEQGTPMVSSQEGGTAFTQYALNALRSMTDYMKRHQLVGARALDRYLSRFGVQLSAEKLNRSVYIGTKSQDIQFGDVMSTADTEGSQLGNYAGKGIGYGQGNFDFETDEYGMIIIVSTIQPKAGYYQGVDRMVMHTGKLDFWTPEFDNLGTQAISKSELFIPTNMTNTNLNLALLQSGIFGFTPRYAEYKIGKDRLTGDYRYNSINTGENSWHTLREVNFNSVDDIVINSNFVRGKDADQYSRIFYNTDASVDKFRIIHHFDIASYSPMKALFDTYEFEDKGKEVIMNANGVKMN